MDQSKKREEGQGGRRGDGGWMAPSSLSCFYDVQCDEGCEEMTSAGDGECRRMEDGR